MFWNWATLILAGVATVARSAAAAQSIQRPSSFGKAWFYLNVTIAGMAAFYVVAFALLILTDIDRANWSRTLTPVSAVSFLIVWVCPAVVHTLERRAYAGLERKWQSSQ